MDRGGPVAQGHLSVASSASGRFLEDLLNEYNYASNANSPNGNTPSLTPANLSPATSTLASNDDGWKESGFGNGRRFYPSQGREHEVEAAYPPPAPPPQHDLPPPPTHPAQLHSHLAQRHLQHSLQGFTSQTGSQTGSQTDSQSGSQIGLQPSSQQASQPASQPASQHGSRQGSPHMGAQRDMPDAGYRRGPSEQAIVAGLRDELHSRASEEDSRPSRGWLRGNLRVHLRGRSTEDLGRQAHSSDHNGQTQRKGSAASADMIPGTLSSASSTLPSVTSQALSTTSGSTKYSGSPPKSSRSFFAPGSSRSRGHSRERSPQRTKPLTPDLWNPDTPHKEKKPPSITPDKWNTEHKEKKKLFWNPFGRKKGKDSDHATENVVVMRKSEGSAPSPRSEATCAVTRDSSTGHLTPTKKSKHSRSREGSRRDEKRLQLDLSNFSMDPSFVPYDLVSPLSPSSGHSGLVPTPIGYSPEKMPNTLPAPQPPPSSGPYTVSSAGAHVLLSQATSTWQPPESWGTHLDSEGARTLTPQEAWTQALTSTDHASVRSVPTGGTIPSASSMGELRTPFEELPPFDDRGDGDSLRGSQEKLYDEKLCAFRLFRRDGTFATISCRESTTAGELLIIMAKKSLISDFSRFNICIVRKGSERILGRTERPLVIQRRLFEQLGYVAADKIELLGREDNSYLCRFVFKEISTGTEIHPDYWRSPTFNTSLVSLSGFNISTVPVALFHFASEIRYLDLSRNLNIQDLPNDLAQAMESLRALSLARNEITRVPKSLKSLRTLSEVDLSYNRITCLEGTGLESVAGLTKLRLGGNLIDRIPEDLLRGCQKLEVLDLSNNRFRSFPVDLCRYLGLSLKHLDLSFCRMKAKIPDAIGELRHLVSLRLAGNRMYGGLPWRLGELQDLRELDLRGNSFGNAGGEEAMVMEVLCRCKKLETVQLDANRVRWVGKWSDWNTDRRTEESDNDSSEEATESKSLECPNLKHLSMSFQFDPHNDRSMVFRLVNLSGSLAELDIGYCGIEVLPKRFFQRLPGVQVLNLSGNRLKELPDFTAHKTSEPVRLSLRELHVANNYLEYLPDDIGELIKLQYLDAKNNNLRELPAGIWRCKSLKIINVTSNRLEIFPTPLPEDGTVLVLGQVVTFGRGGAFSFGGSFGERGGVLNLYGRSPGQADEFTMAQPPTATPSSQVVTLPPLSHSLEQLYLSENHLSDDLYMALYHLPNLTILHASFNEITDITPWVVAIPVPIPMTPWFQKLAELHLSGNLIATLPGEIERMRSLKLLFLNGNKLSTVPGEVGKLKGLEALDLGSQVGGRGEGTGLRYNVSNWPYDWNWNWNLDLKYLNLSGNKRLEIKPSANNASSFLTDSVPAGNTPSPAAAHKIGARGGAIQTPATSGALVANPSQRRRDLTDFNALTNLRLLGLMDVTCLIVPPDESSERRIRTTGSEVPMVGIPSGSVRYGVADCLTRPNPKDGIPAIGFTTTPNTTREGDADTFEVWDLVVPKFRGKDNEALFAVFDGRGTHGGARMAKYLNEWFGWFLANELEKLEKEPLHGRERHSEVGGVNLGLTKSPTGDSGPSPGTGNATGNASGNRSAPGSVRHVHRQRTPIPADTTRSGALDANGITTALRRTFIAVNRELGSMGDEIDDATSSGPQTHHHQPRSSSESKRWDQPMGRSKNSKGHPGLLYGASALVVFLHGSPHRRAGAKCTLYIANVGDGMVVMSKAGGLAQVLAKHHVLDLAGLSRAEAGRLHAKMVAAAAAAPTSGGNQPAKRSDAELEKRSLYPSDPIPWPLSEIERVQSASGWFASSGKLEGEVDLLRGFGFFPFLGAVNADPWIQTVELEVGDDEELLKREESVDSRKHHLAAPSVEDETGVDAGAGQHAAAAATSAGGDEFVVLASGAVWRAVKCGGTYEDGAQMVVDIARSAVAPANPTGAGTSTGMTVSGSVGGTPSSTGLGMTKSSSNLAAHQQQSPKTSGGWSTAAMKVRDVALSLGGGRVGGGYLVMVLGLRDLARKSAWWNAAGARRGSAESSSESLSVEDRTRREGGSVKKGKRTGEEVDLLLKEIAPPVGRLALVFTDIKNSTSIWENNPVAMRAALRLHHTVMRRLLRQTGGYEVKTEGDAFMVSFQNIANAVDWCLTVQGELLNIDWPAEILAMVDGSDIWWQRNGSTEFVAGAGLGDEEDRGDASSDMEVELTDDGRRLRGDGRSRKQRELIFKGLSVRMGIHFGAPLCEVDPITSRMDYYGPMVNRAARVTGASQGGQVLISSDAMKELQHVLGWWEHDGSVGEGVKSGKDLTEVADGGEEVARLKKLGIVTWCIGEVKLKGLETPEVIYAIYRRDLFMRHRFFALEQSGGLSLMPQPQRKPDEPPREIVYKLDHNTLRTLAGICLRLEYLAARCSDEWKEDESNSITPPEDTEGDWAVEGVEEGDREGLIKILEGVVARIENAVSILYLTRSRFSRVLQSLGAAIETDPNHLLRALQLYAEELEERKRRRAKQKEGKREREERRQRRK
ncbi:hypothetical protein SpCBS45565_g01654 [Spizellomyces sp. 'palustris']|nr:hypothetical protein SpCBS45565_g01654 [Spizellomyces sp. 'palustris']